MAVELPKPDTKTELLLLAVVERFDALLEALAPDDPVNVEARRLATAVDAAAKAATTPSPRKRAPKRTAEEA